MTREEAYKECEKMGQAFDDGYAYAIEMLSGTSVAYSFLNEEKDKARSEGRKDGVLWVRKLLRFFWKEWNKTTHKKLSKLALDELEEWIIEQADESNGRVFMEQIKVMDKSNLYKEYGNE